MVFCGGWRLLGWEKKDSELLNVMEFPIRKFEVIGKGLYSEILSILRKICEGRQDIEYLLHVKRR